MHPDDSLNRFSRELRLWSKRGARVSPDEARSRILDVLDSQPSAVETRGSVAFWPRPATLIAGLFLAFALGLLIQWDTREAEPSSPVSDPAVPSLRQSAPNQERFLVVTLTSGNPLYIQLTPPMRSPES